MKLDPPFQLKDKEYKTTDSVITFLDREMEFWKEFSTEYDTGYMDFRNTFAVLRHFKNQLVECLTSGEKDDIAIQNNLQRALNQNPFRISYRNFINEHLILSTTGLAKKILEIKANYGRQTAINFHSALDNGKFSPNHIDRSNLEGIILAYEYTHKKSTLTKVSSSEKLANDHIRDELLKTLSKCQDDTKIHIEESVNTLEELKLGFINAQESAFGVVQEILRKNDEEIQHSFAEWTNKKDHLEKLYEEDLRFKSAAQYWKDLAKTYTTRALWTAVITGSITLITLLFLSTFFLTWLDGSQHSLDLGSLKGAFIFASIVATLGFSFKTLARVLFSSLHLAQDAKEREQLTHFYLALGNESELRESDRELILTALFSRTETGLLQNESGPTLPVNDLAKAFTKSS